jgi:hypothetical protein
VALQGAIVNRDWQAAARQLTALVGTRDKLAVRGTTIPALIDGLNTSVKAQNVRTANEQAYRLATTLLTALDTRAPRAGGGGGTATAVAIPTGAAVALQMLRQASDAAAQVQISLLASDTKAAKTHLDTVRDRLAASAKASPSARYKATIAELDRRRWRVVATLGTPATAYQRGNLLAGGLMRTLRLEGRRIAALTPAPKPAVTTPAPAGGGGGRVRPRPILQDAPPLRNATAPRRGPTKQVSLESIPYDKRDAR